MKKLIYIHLFFVATIFFSSCRNKTVQLLSKKWDCLQVDNMVSPDIKFLSPKDSANAEQLRSVLQSISQTFKNNMRYECALNGRITVNGKYELIENDKIMICTSKSKNSINGYILKPLT